MKSENAAESSARAEHAKRQAKLSRPNASTDMKVNHVVTVRQQMSSHLDCIGMDNKIPFSDGRRNA